MEGLTNVYDSHLCRLCQGNVVNSYMSTKMDVAVYDKIRDGYRVFVGDIGTRLGKYELEKEFKDYGPITDTWVAR